MDVGNKVQHQQCHWYAQNHSDDVLPPIEELDDNVLFSDDVFQNLTVNVNLLWYLESHGIDIFIDVVNLTENLTFFIFWLKVVFRGKNTVVPFRCCFFDFTCFD